MDEGGKTGADKTGADPSPPGPSDSAALDAVLSETGVSPAALTASLYARPTLAVETSAKPEIPPLRRRWLPPGTGLGQRRRRYEHQQEGGKQFHGQRIVRGPETGRMPRKAIFVTNHVHRYLG